MEERIRKSPILIFVLFLIKDLIILSASGLSLSLYIKANNYPDRTQLFKINLGTTGESGNHIWAPLKVSQRKKFFTSSWNKI